MMAGMAGGIGTANDATVRTSLSDEDAALRAAKAAYTAGEVDRLTAKVAALENHLADAKAALAEARARAKGR